MRQATTLRGGEMAVWDEASESTRLIEQERRQRCWFESASELSLLLGSAIDIPAVLASLVERVRELSGADFVATPLIDRSDSGTLEYAAVTGLGLDRCAGARVRRQGVVAAAIEADRPIVTDDGATGDLVSSLPADWHQTMSNLGRAVCIPFGADGELYGALIVGWRRNSAAERRARREMVELVRFAATAGILVLKGRAQKDRARYERWMEGTSEMARLLLSKVDRDGAMRVVARQLRWLADADFVGINLLDSMDPTMAYAVVFEGLDVPVPPDFQIPREGLMASVIESGERLLSFDWTRQEGYNPPSGWAAALSNVGLGMLLPLTVDDEVFGVLFAGWLRGSRAAWAAAVDVGRVQTFADMAAIALQRVRAQDDREHLLLLEQRNRIARELNDAVLQRLFATGLHLKTTRELCTQSEIRRRLKLTMTDLDETNREIRSAIFPSYPDRPTDRIQPLGNDGLRDLPDD
jgi:signal transduction histidine kinase